MMRTKMSLANTMLAATILLALGCSGSGESKPTQQVVGDDLSQYAKASCEYKYEEGSLAEPKSFDNIKITYFKKSLNFALLQPVLRASGSETVRFAESQNVRFFKTSFRDKNNCEFLQTLPLAPSDLAAKFTSVDASSAGLLGLYLEADTKDLPSTTAKAAILVRRDANKWILVHEYMHHLYQIQRNAEMDSKAEDVKTRLTRLSADYDKAVTALNLGAPAERVDLLHKASEKLVEFNTVAFDFLREYLLEEMSIENVLFEKYERNELKNVIEGQRLNGVGYTLVSGKKAKELFLTALEKENDSFFIRYQAELAAEDKVNVQKVQAEVKSINSEIEVLSSRAKAYLRSKNLEFKGLSSVMGITGLSGTSHDGCNHQQGLEEVEQIFKDRMKSLD